MDTGKNESFLVICPGEEHARNKEINLVTKKGQLSMLQIFLLISCILIKEINLRKLFLLSNHVKHNNNNISIIFLHHTEWAKGSKQYCAIVNYDSDVPRKKYKFYDHVTIKVVQDGDVLRPRFFSSEKAERCSE